MDVDRSKTAWRGAPAGSILQRNRPAYFLDIYASAAPLMLGSRRGERRVIGASREESGRRRLRWWRIYRWVKVALQPNAQNLLKLLLFKAFSQHLSEYLLSWTWDRSVLLTPMRP